MSAPVLEREDGTLLVIEDAETWAEELPADEAAGLKALQDAVSWATSGLFSEDTARWIAEETLYQIRTALRRDGRVVLPGVGTLERAPVPGGYCLLALAGPTMAGDGSEEAAP